MAHWKNRKPKTFKGCCGMCTLRSTDGRRNGRVRTLQEKRAEDAERLAYEELEGDSEDVDGAS